MLARRHLVLDSMLFVVMAVVCLLFIGCGEPDAVATDTQATPAPTTATPAQPPPAEPTAPPESKPEQNDPTRQLVREAWDLVLVSGSKVGHSHFQEFAIESDGNVVREMISDNKISMQRFGQTVTQSIKATSIESTKGQVLRFGTIMLSGASELSIAGEFRDGKMWVETTTTGKTQKSSFDWNPLWQGFFADQQSLKSKPMQPGELRTVTALVPGTAQAGEISLKAMAKERVQLLAESRELLRIESELSVAGTKIKSIMWADDAGEVLKMSIPGMNHETYRTTKAVALAPGKKVEFDVGAQTVVKIETKLPSAHETKRIVYRARLKNGSPEETFSTCRSQSVKTLDDHTAEITVHAIRPESAVAADNSFDKPTERDVQPNNLIQSDDGAIVSLAERLADGQTDPWALAKTFEVGVKEHVHIKNFSQAIASASDVVRSQEGDCTEHAVLLAALCRAKKIPARVAIGLVYYGPAQGFAYHMWNEVWIDNGWVPIDATLGRGGIGAGHLKIADSDLATASPISALLPVVEVIGQLELEILSVE